MQLALNLCGNTAAFRVPIFRDTFVLYEDNDVVNDPRLDFIADRFGFRFVNRLVLLNRLGPRLLNPRRALRYGMEIYKLVEFINYHVIFTRFVLNSYDDCLAEWLSFRRGAVPTALVATPAPPNGIPLLLLELN